MDRDYEEFIQTLPKLSANWDRNARPQKREPVAEMPKKAKRDKPKKKPAPSQATKTKEPAFEDVVFVTPPLTPEPQNETIIPVTTERKRDDEFWNFYDQGLPPIK